MLSHHNLAWTSNVAIEITTIGSSDCALSYLPLSHIAEQMFTLHIPITTGARVYFAESIEAVPENLKEVQPTIFFGVPRIWEKLHALALIKANDASWFKRKIMGLGMTLAKTAAEEAIFQNCFDRYFSQSLADAEQEASGEGSSTGLSSESISTTCCSPS